MEKFYCMHYFSKTGQKEGSSNSSVGWQIFYTHWHGSGEFVSPPKKSQQNAGQSEIWKINKRSSIISKSFKQQVVGMLSIV